MEYIELGKLLKYEQPTQYIVTENKYNDKFKTPVLTAGQTFILGYTDEKENIFTKEKLPVIIFDDFTTATKFVDFEFKVKSSAMKILNPIRGINPKYVFYAMQMIKFDTTLHKRYWISAYSNIKIPVPSLEKQNLIVARLDNILNIMELKETQIKHLEKLLKSQFVEMFGDPILNNKQLELKKISEISILKSGKAIKTGELESKYMDGFYYCYGGNGIRGYINRYSHEGEYPIIGRQGALAGNVNFATGRFYATEHAVVANPQVEMNTLWFYHGLKLLNLMRFQTGAAQPGLAVENIGKVEIPFPKIEEQNQFASFVKQVDKQKFC